MTRDNAGSTKKPRPKKVEPPQPTFVEMVIMPRAVVPHWIDRPWEYILTAAKAGRDGLEVIRKTVAGRVWPNATYAPGIGANRLDWPQTVVLRQGDAPYADRAMWHQQNWDE